MGYILLPAILIGCSKDDDQAPGNPGGSNPVAINLVEDFSHLENAEAVEITLNLEIPAFRTGQVTIRIAADDGLQFHTVPAAINGFLTLQIAEEAETVAFTLVPQDDDLIGGMKHVDFTISSASEGFAIGERGSVSVEIIDDELQGKPRSYQSSGGGWKSSKTYLYRPDGQIDRVEWETETPGLRRGTDTYYYEDGKISRINYHDGRDEYFYWDNGRLATSEVIDQGVRKSYDVYAYDEAGNIGGKQQFDLQGSGEYTLSHVFVNLFFTDGNLYRQLTYIPVDTPEEYELISTRTYENYLDKPNMFPVVEVVPTVQAQHNLPGSYRVEENGADLQYVFSYEYDTEGRAVRRTTQGEETTYSYY